MNVQWSVRAGRSLAFSVVHTRLLPLRVSRRWISEPSRKEANANGELVKPKRPRVTRKVARPKEELLESQIPKISDSSSQTERHLSSGGSVSLHGLESEAGNDTEITPTESPAPRTRTTKIKVASSRASRFIEPPTEWTAPHRIPKEEPEYYLNIPTTWKKPMFEGTRDELLEPRDESMSEETAELSGTRVINAEEDTDHQTDHHRSWHGAGHFRAVGNDWGNAAGFHRIGPQNSESRNFEATVQRNLLERETSSDLQTEREHRAAEAQQGPYPTPQAKLEAEISAASRKWKKIGEDKDMSWWDKTQEYMAIIATVIVSFFIYCMALNSEQQNSERVSTHSQPRSEASSIQKRDYLQEQDGFHEQERKGFEEEMITGEDRVVISRRVIRPSWTEALGVAIAGGMAAAVIGTLTFLVVQLYGPQ